MQTTIPQPYGPGSINTDSMGGEVVPISSAASSSLLFSSMPDRMGTMQPMPHDATIPQHHHHHHHHHRPPTALHAGTASNSGFYQGEIRRHGHAFLLDAAGVDHYHSQPNHSPSHVPAPLALLPSQHDILQATLHSTVNSNTTNAGLDDNGTSRYRPRSWTLPTAGRTDQPPGSQIPMSPRPKRRGRRPKSYYLSLSDPSSSSMLAEGGGETDELGADGLPKDRRRHRVLERNRIAATKCRVRKRDEAEALASREKDMEDQNRQLASCFDSLTAEIYHLKNELLRHADCDCVLIQKYIANQARRSVDNMLPASKSPHHRHRVALGSGIAAPPPMGGESVSPYPYGRLGSSTGSSVDSASLRGAEDDGGNIQSHGPIMWANPFPQTVAAPPNNINLPPLSQPQQSLESSRSGHMAPTNMLPRSSVDIPEYTDNLCIGTGQQSRRVNDVGWDYQWNYH